MSILMERRSIRRYLGEDIEEDVIDRILDAADAAPCASGKKSWHFVVIRDRGILDRIPGFHPYSKMILEAPLAILVCADTVVEPREGYWTQNCSAATENILLASTGEGLGSVWLGIYPRMDRIAGMRELLKVPGEVIPFSLVVIGKPDEMKPPHGGHDPGRVHRDRW